MRFALLLMLSLMALATTAQVYTWKDAQGRTHFGDRPPDGVKADAVRIRSYEQPSAPQDWSHVIRGKGGAAASQGVTMYSTDWCGVCRRARSYFAANRIAYTDIDVEKSDAGRREFEALGGKGVPLIVAGGKVMRGFSPEGFEGMRKPAR